MYTVDFKYDGKCLSEYGYIICDFDASNGVDNVDVGSKITFNTVSTSTGNLYRLICTKYDSCIQATFDICKNPDVYDYSDMEFSDAEYRELMRWLNRKEFLEFCFIDNDHERDSCYYDASFNLEEIKINEKLYGVRLTMETNRPFGYGEDKYEILEITDTSQIYKLTDASDEIGYIYPDMTITCNADGDLNIKNITEDVYMVIKNCRVGEVIRIYGDEMIIETSYSSHAIYNDFNFEFFRIANTFGNRINEITVSIPCKLEIRYSPIIKGIF